MKTISSAVKQAYRLIGDSDRSGTIFVMARSMRLSHGWCVKLYLTMVMVLCSGCINMAFAGGSAGGG